MTEKSEWYDQDAFWELFEPILFNRERQALAVEQTDQIEKLLQLEPGARILDLPCGSGRHSLELAGRGYEVTGVDRTARYIESARQEAARRDLDVRFVLEDMRAYRAPAQYDAALNLFGSFGYFAAAGDDRNVVENMLASLRPGGRFLIETMGKEILARDFRAREWSEAGDMLILSEKTISQNWGRVDTRWIVIRAGERFEHRVSIRSYAAAELASLLAAAGFADVRVYGSLEGSEYDQNARRLVVVGRKSEE